MKKISLVLFVVYTFISCTNKEDKGFVSVQEPEKAVTIFAGEYIGNIRLYSLDESYIAPYQKQYDKDADIRINILLERHHELGSTDNDGDKVDKITERRGASSESKKNNPLGWRGFGEWFDNHINYFKGIDSDKYLYGDYLGKYPVFYSLTFYYVRIKSLKLYSLNCEVAGREIGSDLSDLFECRYHPMLFNYPDCSSFVEDYMSDSTPFPLSKYVELGMCPESNIIIYPTFPLVNRKQYCDINYRLEMVIEDEVRGETYLSADLIQK